MRFLRPISSLVLAVTLVISGCSVFKKMTGEDESPKNNPAAEQKEDSKEASSEENGKPTKPNGFSGAKVVSVVSTMGGHAVILGKKDGDLLVPIFIGQSQAMAIKLRLERRRYTRPLTHDLLDTVVTKLGGDVIKVHIDAIKSGVFVGTVYVRGEEETFEIDARSSDAIALAVGNHVPIYVAQRVFDKAGVSEDELKNEEPGESKPPGLKEDEPSKEEGPYY